MRVSETAHWLEWQDWANPVLQQPYEVTDGKLRIPNVPGVGLEWDENAVAAHLADNFNPLRQRCDCGRRWGAAGLRGAHTSKSQIVAYLAGQVKLVRDLVQPLAIAFQFLVR
jgi:hypothetical protein